jgi:hypothetical protein
MKDTVLAIYDDELDYAAHLADYLRRKESKFSEIRVFTNEKSLEDFLGKHSVDILLIGESLFEQRQEWENVSRFVLLSEGKLIAEDLQKEQVSVYKFQSAENIRNELNDIYALNEKPAERKIGGEQTKVIGVFSPCGGSRKTIFSLNLGEILGKKRKVLYLNLECFSGISRQVYENSMEGLSELLYYIRERNVALLQKMQSMICKMGTVDTIPPVNHFRDLMEISEEDVDILMGELKGGSVYDYVILDLGYFHISTFQWLFRCDMVFLTGGEDKISVEKKKTLRHYMQMEGREELWNRFYDIHIPKIKNMDAARILEVEEDAALENLVEEIQKQVTS